MRYRCPYIIKACCLVAILPCSSLLRAQYYHTGAIFTDSVTRAPYTKIRLKSNMMLYKAGATGEFGIPGSTEKDTLVCWTDGYDTAVVAVAHGKPTRVMLRPTAATLREKAERGRLSSLVPNLVREQVPVVQQSGETYPVLVENKFISADKYPATGFSPHSNKASYANLRRLIRQKASINPNAIRLEELLNYFSIPEEKLPQGDTLFSLHTRLTPCPWNKKTRLLAITAQAKKIDFSEVPPANLVFLIDNSGSMDMPNRLPLLKSAFSMLVKSLRPQDRVAIVTYGGMAGIYLPPLSGIYRDSILKAIDNLEAGGVTAGSGGIQLAYQLATTNPMPEGNNRVIMATDGDFNVGAFTEKELENLITAYRRSGVSLTCLGVGMGNFKDSKIETLARFGNGNYAYLDNEQEAEKVMVQELTRNLYSVASDVTVHVALHPAFVHSYRLLGYDNRLGALYHENPLMVGGDIGSGFAMHAFMELQLTDSAENLLAAQHPIQPAEIRLRFTDAHHPEKGPQELKQMAQLVLQDSLSFPKGLGFLTAVAGFGMLVKQSPLAGNLSPEKIKEMVIAFHDSQNREQVEFLGLVEALIALRAPAADPPARRRNAKPRKTD